jgi:IS5 family transposase
LQVSGVLYQKSRKLKFMLPAKKDESQLGFYSTFEEQLSRKHPLFILANTIDWQKFEESFSKHYCDNNGRPAKPIRMMVSLLILKHLRNLSDESVVEQWSENSYYQYFSGEKKFACGAPCEASELVHFRHRIGPDGMELIFQESIRINGSDGREDKVIVDTTVQEKNITFPTDAKLHRKIIKKCSAIAEDEDIDVRQSYTRVLKKLGIDQRFRNHPKNKGKARKADKKIKTIAGRLVRELERRLPAGSRHYNNLELFKKVLLQKRSDSKKIYSLHEPDVSCISKGKEHKRYEFGNKVSITITQNTGVITGALSFTGNPYDGHTLPAVLAQHEKLTGIRAKEATTDRGEYWKGTQPGTDATTMNPGTLPTTPTYLRNFDAAFIYFLQNIINEKWEVMAKYDWYDPNVKVKTNEIGKAGTNLTIADVRYDTYGFGLTRYFTGNFKMLAYYEIVHNETTGLNNFQNDIEDNVFTLRMQFRF